MASVARPNFRLSHVDVPKAGDILLDFADRQAKMHQAGLDNAMRQAEMEEDRNRYMTELGFKQRQEGRAIDELNRAQATREAVQATIDPNSYRDARLGEVDTAIAQSLNNLSPQDRAIAEQELKDHYNKGATGKYVLDRARDSVQADPIAVLEARLLKQKLEAGDPTTNAAAAADLLGVGTTYTEVGESNADTIKNIKQANEKIGNLQQAYGDAYVKAYWKNPNYTPEQIDAEARKAVNISNTTSPIDKVIPLARVPEYYEETKVSQKSLDQYTRDLFNEAKRKGSLNPSTIQLIDSLTKNYEAALRNNSEKVKENVTLGDLQSIIKDLGGDPNSVRTKEGGLRYVEALEARMKANNKDGFKVYGPGADSLLAKSKTGLSDDAWKNIKTAAAKKKISDADLAKLIEASDLPDDFWFTWSSTQKKLVEDMLQNYPNKN